MRLLLCACACALSLAWGVNAWYLPGSAPRSYANGQSVPVHVNALQPMAGATPVHGLVSYDYYDERLGFCRPSSGIKAERGSLGSILFGDRIYNSPLTVDMLQAKSCVPICKTQATPEQADFINKRIFERYAVNWMVDGLPAADIDLATNADRSLRANSVGFVLGTILDAQGHRLQSLPAEYFVSRALSE